MNNNYNNIYQSSNQENGYTQNSVSNIDNNYTNNTNSSSKTNRKKLFIIILLVVGISVGLFFYLKNNKISRNSNENLNIIYDPDKPIIIKKDNKYGYIKSDGRIMIEPQYKTASDFNGDYAIVTVDNPDQAYSYEKTYQIIDKKGDVKITSESYLSLKYYSNYNIWIVDCILYDSKLNPVLEEGVTVDYISNGYLEYIDNNKQEVGIITYKGKKILSAPGYSISAEISENKYTDVDLYASVKIYSEEDREFIISLKTGDVLFTSEDSDKYYISDDRNGIFYYYNHTLDDGYKNKKYFFFIDNKLAYQTTEFVDDLEVYDYENKILRIDYGYNYKDLNKEKRYNYYDVKNNEFLTSEPASSTTTTINDIMELTYGYKKFSSSSKYGLMNGESIILPAEYDDVKFIDQSLFEYIKNKKKQEFLLVQKNKKTILIDLKNKKELTVFDYRYVYDTDGSTFIKSEIYDENSYQKTGYQIYNVLTGASIMLGKDENVNIKSNYITVIKNKQKRYYNTKLEEIYVEEV